MLLQLLCDEIVPFSSSRACDHDITRVLIDVTRVFPVCF
jgi:hypothetical protein